MYKIILKNGFILEDKQTYSDQFVSLIKEYIESDFSLKELDKIVEYFSNISLYCFHLTRLMKEEIIDIEKNGLNPSSKKMMSEKINLIYQKKLISEEEYDKLKKIKFYEGHNAEDINSIFFIPYNPNRFGNEGLLLDYGGEQFFSMIEQCKEIEGEILKEKLRIASIPCMIIFRISPDSLVAKLHKEKTLIDLINDLCDCYIENTLENIIIDKRLKSNIKIYKILKFDKKDIERIKSSGYYIKIKKNNDLK